MPRNLTALRFQIESSLAGQVSSSPNYGDSQWGERVSTRNREIDLLTGGLPRGAITEICGPGGSGRTSLMMSILAARTEEDEACVLIDGSDAFDIYSAEAAGVRFKQLLWVRCQNIDQALRATDLVLHAGGFGMVILDLGDIPPEVVHHVSLPVWFRFRRAVEYSPTVFLVLEQEPHAKTCASLVLQMETERVCWSRKTTDGREFLHYPHACLFAGMRLQARMVRNRIQPMMSPQYFNHGYPATTLETEYRAIG